jgi:hypothetical protein
VQPAGLEPVRNPPTPEAERQQLVALRQPTLGIRNGNQARHPGPPHLQNMTNSRGLKPVGAIGTTFV